MLAALNGDTRVGLLKPTPLELMSRPDADDRSIGSSTSWSATPRT